MATSPMKARYVHSATQQSHTTQRLTGCFTTAQSTKKVKPACTNTSNTKPSLRAAK